MTGRPNLNKSELHIVGYTLLFRSGQTFVLKDVLMTLKKKAVPSAGADPACYGNWGLQGLMRA